MIHMIDLCSLQGTVDWDQVKKAGFDGVYIKSSQYTSTRDYKFSIYVAGANAAGISAGAYHFAYCGSDPIEQAKFFFKAAEGHGKEPGQLPPALDLEFAKGMAAKDIVDWGVAFMAEAKQLWYPHTDRCPILYTYPYFAQTLQPFLEQSNLGQYPLWFAGGPHYADARKANWSPGETYTGPKPPKPWTKVTINQYSGDHGMSVPGISVDCDRDLFFGSSAEWDVFRGIIRKPDSIEGKAAETVREKLS